MKWWDQMPWSLFSECWALSQLFHSFTFIKRLFSSSPPSAIRMMSSAYLRLLIFLLAIFFFFFCWNKEYNFICKARCPRRWQASAPAYHLIWVWMPVSFIDREEQEVRKVKVKVTSLSPVRLFATPWTVAYQAPLSMGFSRQGYWTGNLDSSLCFFQLSVSHDVLCM